LEKQAMLLKQRILLSVTVLTLALSGPLFAQTASDQAKAAAAVQERADRATDTAQGQPPGTAEQHKQMLVDEATAADTKAHAYPTQANRQARDEAEAAAAAAAGMSQPMDQTAPR
jgi:hypothetical protein